MIRIRDTLGGETVTFHYVNKLRDTAEVRDFVKVHSALGIDTESTGVNSFRPDWQLRTVQVGDAYDCYVIPARWRKFIEWLVRQEMNWIAHNGPHDIRSIDMFLGYETGLSCAGETYIPAHHFDSRKQEDGGTGHGLKELATAHVSHDAGKWEVALKKAFKEITIPIPGEVYKSGPKKGTQKVRKAKLSEGWALIDPEHPAYIAYAGADPILTYRLWRFYQPVVKANYALYHFDKRVQQAADTLARRAMLLDERYTRRLDAAYIARAEKFKERAAGYGCFNLNSGPQIAETIIRLGGTLKAKTDTGQYKTDADILRGLAGSTPILAVQDFIHCVLGAKQLLKRRESYTEAMLREMDAEGRVHPSINTLGARTTRMSVSGPPLQQLPTQDRETDAE